MQEKQGHLLSEAGLVVSTLRVQYACSELGGRATGKAPRRLLFSCHMSKAHFFNY